MKEFLKVLRKLGRRLRTTLKHAINRYLIKAGLPCLLLFVLPLQASFSDALTKKYPIIITQEQRVGILEDRITELERENQRIHPLEVDVACSQTEVMVVRKVNRNLCVAMAAGSVLWTAILVFLVLV